MYSVFGWFLLFDLGIGSGLKNKLTIALAKGDIPLAKKYVSTAYISIGILILILIVLFLAVFPFINWVNFFNATGFEENKFRLIVLICGVCTLLAFLINLVHSILYSSQKIGRSNILLFISQFLLLLITYFFKAFHVNNFFLIISVFVTVPLLANSIYTFYAFKKSYKEIKPSFKLYNKISLNDILGFGLKFFVLQLSLLVIYCTDNIFISHLYTPSKVTEYNIVVRYFSVITVVFSVITSPMMALYTDAFTKDDYSWIRVQVKRLTKIWALLIGGVICMFFVSSFVFHIWLGKSFNVSSFLVMFVGIYTLECIWISIFSVPINGIGKIKLQVIYSAVAAVVNILLILFFHKLLNNVNSIVIANIVTLLVPCCLAYIQYKLVITKRSKGIYDK
ncbi:MAG: oligosaccharide flippase family protein [Ferruginibacter sp.]